MSVASHPASEPDPAPDLLGADVKVALSTASVYPESTAAGFEMAVRLGFDAVGVAPAARSSTPSGDASVTAPSMVTAASSTPLPSGSLSPHATPVTMKTRLESSRLRIRPS